MASSDRVVAAASSTLSLCTVLSDESISIDEQNPLSINNNVLVQFDNNEEKEDEDDNLGTGSFVEISGFSEVASNIGDDDIDSDYVADFEDIDNDNKDMMKNSCITTTIQSQPIIDNDNEEDIVLRNRNHNDDDNNESVRSLSVSASQDLSFTLDSSLSSAPSIRHSRNPTPDESLFVSETIIIQEGEMNYTASTFNNRNKNRNRNDSSITPIMDNTRYILSNTQIENTTISCPLPSMSCSEKPPQLIGSFGTNDSHCTEEEQTSKHVSVLSSLRWNTRDRTSSKGEGSGTNKKQKKDSSDNNNNCSTILTSKIATKVRSISPVIFGVAVSAIVVAGAILVQSFVSNRRSLLASSATSSSSSQVTKDEDDNNNNNINKFGTSTSTFEILGM